MKYKVKYSGKIASIVEHEANIAGVVKTFEYAVRSPGVRAIIFNKQKKEVLLSLEYRHEEGREDLRLPGGMVFDDHQEFLGLYLNGEDFQSYAEKAVAKETLEEVGLKIHNPKLLKVSSNGSKVIWDLYYFLANDFTTATRSGFDEGEEDIKPIWVGLDELRELLKAGRIAEDRTVGVLYSLLDQQAQLLS